MTDQNDKPGPVSDPSDEPRSPDEVVRLFLQAESLREKARVVTRRLSRIPLAGQPAQTREQETAGPKNSGRVVELLLRWHPTPRQASCALIAVLAIAMPLLLPSMLLLSTVLLAITYLSLGHDRSAEIAAAGYRNWERRDPDSAEIARTRAARWSARLSRLIERLPDSWTQGLHVPDFEKTDPEEDPFQGDPFDRLREKP